MQVLLVHGFCGLPEDWDLVCKMLLKKTPELKIHTLNLWRELPPSQFSSLESAGERLASLLEGEDWIVVGYSLGGRILSHWPSDEWSRIQKMILISTHGGLESEIEKKERWISDQKWAERFLKEPWDSLQRDWNNQSVFAGDSQRLDRLEEHFNRFELAKALKNWSLSLQKNIFSDLKSASFPIHYVTGSRDSKFTDYAKGLKAQLNHWNFYSLTAGHSLHLSHPQEVSELVLGSIT